MAAINKNNTIQKVISILADKADGDTVMLLDGHFNNALKTVCKFVAENKPKGHEKLLLEQTVLFNYITKPVGDTYYRFPISAFTYPVVETGSYHRCILQRGQIPDNYVVVDGAGTAAVNGVFVYNGDYGGKPYYNLVGQPNNVIQYSIFWNHGFEWSITGAASGTTLYSSEEDVDFPYDVLDWIAITGSGGLNPPPTVTEGAGLGLGEDIPIIPTVLQKGYVVNEINALELATAHGSFYYKIDPYYVYINSNYINNAYSITVTHYIYATASQFPEELEDLLIMELIKLVQNEPQKQLAERQENR